MLLRLSSCIELTNANHSAHYTIDSRYLTYTLRAVRAIGAHEEVTTSYASPLRLWAQRQQYFKDYFGFTCQCSRCAPHLHGSSRTIEESDAATTRIVELQRKLEQATKRGTAEIRDAEELVKVYEDEGLQAFMDKAYEYAALAYAGKGSTRGVRKYAKLAGEAVWARSGVGSITQVEMWDKVERSPEDWSAWKRRKTEL
jgi:hypothetical protein